MANSKYEYVRSFEQPDNLLANTWIVVRIDGRGFSKLTTKYKFVKPNDKDALDLMNAAAAAVMKELPDLVLAYGNSDEFSFVFHKDCVLFERRASKLTTTIVSTFTSHYVFLWPKYFPNKPLTPPLPSFDGRAVCYPSDTNLRDYMSWRQADCHINNLYNTTFWALVQQGGMEAREAEQRLSGTVSSDKHEILFKEFGINYNNEPECFKKGTVLYRDFYPTQPAQPLSAPVQAPGSSKPLREPNSSTPLAQPEFRRYPAKSFSKPFEQVERETSETIVSPQPANPGLTFLSTSSTSSPSSSPTMVFESVVPNPLRSHPFSHSNMAWSPSSMPLSPPSTITSPSTKQPARIFTPLPLSPPILKPSNGPPLSLHAPNPTTRDNFSPSSPPASFSSFHAIPSYSEPSRRYISHSASASVPLNGSSREVVPRQRSPSLSTLPTTATASYSTDTPPIPLRISSIPPSTAPRKLSLQYHRPSQSSLGEKEVTNLTSPYLEMTCTSSPSAGPTTVPTSSQRKPSPPLDLRTNKALPSPPMSREEEVRTREKVIDKEINEWRKIAQERREEQYAQQCAQQYPQQQQGYNHRIVAVELPASSSSSSSSSSSQRVHARVNSGPAAVVGEVGEQKPNLKAKTEAEVEGNGKGKGKGKGKEREQDGNTQSLPSHLNPNTNLNDQTENQSRREKQNQAESPNQNQKQKQKQAHPQSRTQREKERKKRHRAAILVEHVDVIRDEFWEARPWILSGGVGC